jgi:hypothetical protein
MQQQQKQERVEPKKFQFCDVQEEGEQQEQTLHTAITQQMQETVHIPGAWADLLLDESWTTVQRKKRKTK